MTFPNQTNSSWTPERVARLRELWPVKSASEIAAELGGLTRSAVIGKANRLNLEVKQRTGGRHIGPCRTPVVNIMRKLRRQLDEKEEIRKRLVSVADNPPLAQRKTIIQLNGKTCRWIIGEPSSPYHFYCGGDVEDERPYCPGHCARAYVEARR